MHWSEQTRSLSVVFNYLEAHTIKEGKNLKDMSLEEMDAIWNEAKAKGL
mgnify:CR=1 FL=1